MPNDLAKAVSRAARLARIAKDTRPQYFDDPAVDKLLQMVVVLAQELSVTRERLATVEALIEKHGLFERRAIDTAELSDADAEARAQRHNAFLERFLRVVTKEIEELGEARD